MVATATTKTTAPMLATVDSIMQIERHPITAKRMPLLPEKGIKSSLGNEKVHVLMGVMQNK